MKHSILLLFIACTFTSTLKGQDDLLSLIEEEEVTEYVRASFKTNRVINLHSLENTAPGVLDIKISHRFGTLNQGIYELFGLDNASIRIGADLGITPRIAAGFGRSSVDKTYDGFLKYKFLRQSRGKKKMPVTAAAFASVAVTTLRFQDPDRQKDFSSRLFYTFQVIVGRKFSESFSLQLSPTVVHRNLVPTTSDNHDIFALGIAARQKITKRLAVNAEYIYVPDGQLAEGFRNSFSIGFDIETGGHVFQLHFTNSTAMIEKGYITETTGDWGNGDIHFGFNISRVFTLWDRQ